MGMLLQRNKQRRTQEIEVTDEIVSDSQTKEVVTQEVEATKEKPKRKPRAKKA